MLRKEWVGLAFLLCLGVQASLWAETLAVVHAEAPKFTEVAKRARLAGTALVRVEIDPAGKVTSGWIEKGLPMGLDRGALAAALLWRFNPDPRGKARDALLTFVFDWQETSEEPTHEEVIEDAPFTLRIVYTRSTVIWLPRENGEVPEKLCPVHGTLLAVEQVAVHRSDLGATVTSDDPAERSRLEAYEEALAAAQATVFPESHWLYEGGIGTPETKAEVYYCQACRDAEKAWRRSHPEPGREQAPSSEEEGHP